MPFDSTAFINPQGEGGSPNLETAAATLVLGTIVNLVDWQYRRTADQLSNIYGLGLNLADFAADTARNIWDQLNGPRTPDEINDRPDNAPDPTDSSKYVKPRNAGGFYGIRATHPNGNSKADYLGEDSYAYYIDLIYDPLQQNISSYGGWYVNSFSNSPQNGQSGVRKLFPGEISPSIPWGYDPNVTPVILIEITHYVPGQPDRKVDDFDPFIGPVPGRPSPLKASPIPSPLPKPKPSTPPFPKPQPEPERKTQPSQPQPQPQPQPEPQPSPNPTPSPIKPEPATTPTTKPSPFIPNIVPQVLPPKTTPTNPDGSRQTAPIVGPITTPVGSEKIGPITIPKNSPQPTLEGIAGEVGRIEQKLASMIRPSAGDDLTDRIGLLGSILKAIYEQFFTGLPAGEYILSSPCEKDEQGDRVEYQVPILQTVNKYDAIFERLDALANLIQTHKDLKQPICRGSQPTGQPVTVNFTQIE